MTTKGKKIGRPESKEGKRVRKIDARFTEDEYQTVLALEKQLGIRKTDLIRSGILNNASKTILNARDLITQLDAIGIELRRSGNNINQLARYANILINKQTLSAHVLERFNELFEQYITNQRMLESSLRKIIRAMAT